MDRIASLVGRVPLGGLVITLVALMGYWSSNRLRLGFENVWPTATVAALCAAALTILLRLALSSWARAGLLAAMVAVYLFYVPAFLSPLGLPFAAAAALHLAAIGGFAWLYRALPADEAAFLRVAGRINIATLIVFLVTLLPLAVQQVGLERHRARAAGSLGQLDGRASEASPDVWHILLDRYAAVDTLRERYQFDNRPFIAALRERGFTVQDRAYSNYQRTSHSLASTLNGSLLDPMGAERAASPSDWVPIYRAIRKNAAMQVFNGNGYRTVFAGSWWEPTRFSHTARESIAIRAIPQLARLMLDSSAIGFWTKSLQAPYLDSRADQCFRANEKFRRLRDLATDPARKHVFAHFLVPHPPFVLNPDGSCKSLDAARHASRTENYLDQVRFANRETLRLIDAILAGPRPAVIVLHSDEGPWPEPYVGDEHGLGTDPVAVPWAKLTDGQMQEKMGILLAVRDPSGRPPATMPASPVQIYPAILKDHFRSARPLPRSGHYVFESDAALYQFHDISAQLAR